METPACLQARARYEAAHGQPEERAALKALVDQQQAELSRKVPAGKVRAKLCDLIRTLNAAA